MTRWSTEETARLCRIAQDGHAARARLKAGGVTRGERRRLTAAAGDGEQAEQTLIVQNRGFIAMLAERFGREISTTADQRADLMQSATLGFLRAIRSYDPERGTRLTTLATITIREEANELVRGRHVTSGKTAAKQGSRLARLIEPLRAHLGRDPSADELTEHFNAAAISSHIATVARRPSNAGLGPQELWEKSRRTLAARGELVSPRRAETLLRMRTQGVSLQRITFTGGGEPGSSLDERLPDHNPIGKDPADIVADADEHQARLNAVVASMDRIVADNPTVGRMLRLRFGYEGEGGKPHSYPEIAQVLGVTTSEVQRHLSQALRELRDMTDTAIDEQRHSGR